jgi:pimeloyl-ACP methyl ester carboxylesterase
VLVEGNVGLDTVETGTPKLGDVVEPASTLAAQSVIVSLQTKLVRGVAGTLLAGPWFDGAGLYVLRRWYFPASRMWAAAHLADGDSEAFFDAVPMPRRSDFRPRMVEVLARFQAARASAQGMTVEWERVFFGPGEPSEAQRIATETARITTSHAYNSTRQLFRFLVNRSSPRAKPAIATPAEVEGVYGAAISDLGSLTAAPEPGPTVEVSRSIPGSVGRDFWLRFKSPSARLGDTVYARVHEPIGVSNPPTIIYGHGICVEFDHWRGLIDECQALVRLGFRVIRPEAPWHGRRKTLGSYGGEPVIAAFPMGALDCILGATQEWAVLARWARETSTGPLAFGGSSLGAMTSQFAADRANDWPEVLRPDALLLITHTEDLCAVVTTGALANMWFSPADVQAKGWTSDLARRYLSLLEPTRPLCVASRNIVSVLGRRDIVLPYHSGQELVEKWAVPEQNCFVWDRGHFSVPTTLIRNDAPLIRFAQVVAEIGARRR